MPKPRATLKQSPADFRVAEQIDFPLTGHGEHLWCYVEKTSLNTAWLKREWARLTDCPPKDIAHSGLKDRHAITRQWLSLPAKYGAQLPDSGDGWQILERQQNERKLRVGAHRYNQFAITLRDIDADRASIEAALAALARDGFPNHFGDQRFGHTNRDKAQRWVERGQLPKKHDERAQVLSTLRADAYNAQLDARLAAATLHAPQPGDRAMLAGSNSHFTIETVDDALLARLASGDIALGGWLPGKEKNALPPAVTAALRDFRTTDAYRAVAAEARYVADYKQSWAAAPYPPIFVTVDALVLCREHVLVVKRGGQPGYGLLALPGGFLNPDEKLRDACLRELHEETGLHLSRDAIRRVFTADKPDRSAIGRVITHLHIIHLDGEPPAVKGMDDAAAAFWLPLSELRRDRFHDDHYYLIQDNR